MLQRGFRKQFRNGFRKVSMHFHDSKTDKDCRNGDVERNKETRAGGSDPTLCGYPAAQNLSGSGVATARAFREFAAQTPAPRSQDQNQICIRP